MDRLDEFLRDASRREFRLGVFDCGLWLADWYVAKTGRDDPAARLRGAYYEPGDLAVFVRAIAARAGLTPVTGYRRGDVGLLKLSHYLLGGIYTGTHWVMLGARGLCGSRHVGVVQAWRIA